MSVCRARLTAQVEKAAAWGTSLSGGTNLPVGTWRYINMKKRGMKLVENHQMLEGRGFKTMHSLGALQSLNPALSVCQDSGTELL